MKKLISLILIILIFIPTVYASGSTPDTSSNILVLFMDLTNILWLPFVFIAGQLLTNDFVYGTFLGVDKVLWNIWNISKTTAMVILGVMFIWFIFMTFFSKEQGFKAVKELPKIIIAALLINISFFLLGAMIDVSTILIGVAGQLPKTIVSEDTNNKRYVRVCNEFKIALKTKGESKELLECTNRTQGVKMKEYLDGIANSSGILIYLASSILHIEQVSNIPGGDSMSLKSMTIATAVKVITSLLFIIPLIILIIINIIRIFRIWLYVAFAPLIVLDIVFGSKVGSEISKNQAFSLHNVIGMIFQPVLVVAALSLVVIFMTMLQITFTDKNSEGLKALQATKNGEKITMVYGENKKNLLTIDGNLGIKDDVTAGFGQLIISLIGVLLMWGIIKASFKFTDISKKMSKSLFEFGEETAKAIPIVGGLGYGAMSKVANKRVFNKGFNSTAAKQAQPIVDAMNKALGINAGDINNDKSKKFLSQLTLIKSAKDHLKLLRQVIEEGIKRKSTLAYSPNFKDVIGKILESLERNNNSFKLKEKGEENKTVNRSKYLENHNDATALIMGLYLTQDSNGKLDKRIDSISQFATLKPYIQSGSQRNIKTPFISKKKEKSK